MRSLLLCLLAFFADDPWPRVRDLKSGTELRIHPHNTAAPINAQFGDTTVTPRSPYESRIPKTESSGGISFGKPDFETLYERAPSAKK